MKKIILGLSLAVVLVAVNVADARTLSLGARGDDVAQLQTWLVDNGYPIPLIESGRASKGYFGVQTQDAVKMYQESNEQNPTGVMDSTGYGNTSVKLGAVTGPDVNFHSYFNAGLTRGGYVATSSTATTYTTVAKDFTGGPTYIAWTPNINTTISLSSTSTQPYLNQIGDTADVVWKNASTTSGTITFAAKDANVDLQNASSTLVLQAKQWAMMTYVKTGTYSVAILFRRMIEAD